MPYDTSVQSLKVLQYNVNKSRNKVMIGLLQDPDIETYDILAIQEPWRGTLDHASYNPRQSAFHSSDQRVKDSRVLTLVNKRICTEMWAETHHSKDLTTITLKVANPPGRIEDGPDNTISTWLRGTENFERTINIHNVYNPPCQHSAFEETESLRALRTALRMPGEHIVLGDMNLHHPSWTGPTYPLQHKLADTLLEIVREAEMKLLLPPKTITRDCQRGNSHEQTTIDLIFATSTLENQLVRCQVETEREQSSDHLPIGTEFEWSNQEESKSLTKRRAWKKMNQEVFIKSLSTRTRSLENHTLNTREEIDHFTYELTKSVQAAIEDSTPWLRPSSYSQSFWTNECQDAVKNTRKARREFTRNPSLLTWQNFVQQRNQKGKVLTKAKREDFRKTMQDAATKPQGIWKIVRWARQRSQGQTTQISFPTLKQGMYEAKDAKSKAELLRDTCFPPPPEVDLTDIEGFIYPQQITQDEEIAEREILKAISRTKKDKAPGPDDIPNRVVQILVREKTKLIKRLFQACLTHGVQPAHFKTARTVMLKKPGKEDYSNPSAYRPIALLNTLGKILESVISNRIKYFAESYELLPDSQYGARPLRATETALQQITEKIHTIWGRGNKRVASLLSLDVTKAFDRVSHVRLAHNLRKRRIPESLVRWVTDFLSDRRTEVKVNEFVLPEAAVSVGIPQGSPISPILYLFYNADLLEKCENIRLRTSGTGFVDDVNILTYSESTERNCQVLMEIHKECIEWAKKHGSKFCPNKYELIHFSRTKKNFNMRAGLNLEGQEICPKEDVRILGVQMDTTLRWQPHLRAIEAKSVHLVNALRTITGSTWGASLDAGKQVYQTVVRPAITYGASVWHTPREVKGHRMKVSKKLQTLQGKCLRTITGAYKATSTEALEVETHIQPLDLHTETLAAKATIRVRTSKAIKGIKNACARITRQTAGHRGRTARPRATPGDLTSRWLEQFDQTNQERTSDEAPLLDPPWEKPRERTKSQRLKKTYGEILSFHERKWKERWKDCKKGKHSRMILPEPCERSMTPHRGLKKHESSLLTQLRTGKIGFNHFLYERKVPGIESPRCECTQDDMTVEHVLLECPQWTTERRELIDPLRTTDLRKILSKRKGCRAAIKMVLRTKLLGQFGSVSKSHK